MAAELTVLQHNFVEVRARLNAAGATGLKKELNKALKAAAAELKTAEQTAALALPAAGPAHTGLRASIAGNTVIRVTDSHANPGVRVYVKKPAARLGSDTNKARGWRHPVFGNRAVWVVQVMSPGWWGQAAKPKLAEAQRKVKAALDETARKIAHG